MSRQRAMQLVLCFLRCGALSGYGRLPGPAALRGWAPSSARRVVTARPALSRTLSSLDAPPTTEWLRNGTRLGYAVFHETVVPMVASANSEPPADSEQQPGGEGSGWAPPPGGAPLPEALVALDPERFPTMSRARKACRRGLVLINGVEVRAARASGLFRDDGAPSREGTPLKPTRATSRTVVVREESNYRTRCARNMSADTSTRARPPLSTTPQSDCLWCPRRGPLRHDRARRRRARAADARRRGVRAARQGAVRARRRVRGRRARRRRQAGGRLHAPYATRRPGRRARAQRARRRRQRAHRNPVRWSRRRWSTVTSRRGKGPVVLTRRSSAL